MFTTIVHNEYWIKKSGGNSDVIDYQTNLEYISYFELVALKKEQISKEQIKNPFTI